MKRSISLILAVVLLLGFIPTFGMPVAAATTADPDVVTFEQWAVGTDLSDVFAAGTVMATVSDTKAKDGTHSAKLEDTSNGSAAVLRHTTEDSSVLNLQFDMYPDVGGLQFRLASGGREEANTAFWIAFVNKQINGAGAYYTFLQYYNGSQWIDVHQFEGTLAKKWHTVQVSTAVDSKAAVYVDGQYLAEVPRCGNNYGTKVTTTLNSVIFECGNANATGGRVYLDNLKLIPVLDSIYETFESYNDGDVPHFPFTDVNMAAVSTKKAKDGTKSIFIADTVNKQTAVMRVMTRKTQALSAEFDIMPAVGQAAFRITNGLRGEANTAFWFKFANLQDKADGQYYTHLQQYTGSTWVDIHKFDKTLANTWHAVRVEAAVNGKAKIFVDGQYLGDASHCTGAYGANAYTEIDSLVFECGDTQYASWSYYVDNVRLAPIGALDKDFEDAELSGSAAALPGYVSDTNTVITKDPVNVGGKALYMGDDSNNQVAHFEYGYEFYDKYTMEFDVYAEKANNTITFQVYDGRGGEENTAFFLQFNYAYGLRVYHGSWNDEASRYWEVLNEEAKLEKGVWNKIRIEINTYEPAEAVIYLNDQLVGNTDVVYHKEDPVRGIHISTGDASQSCYIDNLKMSPASFTKEVQPVVEENFEALDDGANLTTVFASGTAMATVSSTKASDSTKSAYLADSSASSAALMRVATDKTNKLELDFDYHPVTGGMNFRFTNGGRNEANTAYWLGLVNAKGADGQNHTYLRYYTGTAWIDVYEFAGTLANKWSKIHVEVTLGGTAKVLVNGEQIGEVPGCSGNYGTNATTEIDSVIFEVGDAKTTTGKVYLDNVKLAAAAKEVTVHVEPTEENFESVVLSAPVENGDQLGAEIHEDPINAGGKALRLYDKEASAYVDYTFQSYNSLNLEFDVYIPTAQNTISFQLYDGSRAYSNTVFFLQFNHESGLRMYNGSYSVLNANAKLKAKTWNKVRVEAVNGEKANASIYLNNALVATVNMPYNVKETVNGVYFFTGAKEQCCYIDNLKVNTAINVTQNGMHLEKDFTIDELTVEAGKVLDLHGYTLNAKKLACFGSIIDSSQDKTGKLITDELYIGQMGDMPVYDKANGWYRFFDYSLKSLGVRKNDNGTVTYGFAVNFANTEAYELLATGNSGLNVNMELAWGENKQTVAIAPVYVSEYAQIQAKHPHAQAAIMLTVVGLHTVDAGTELAVTPSVNVCNATVTGKKLVHISDANKVEAGKNLLEVQVGESFMIADNSEKEGLPTNNTVVKEDFSASGGVYGFTQIPNAVYDPDTNQVYVNYTRHRDVNVDYPYDSTRVYDVNTLLNAQAGAQLQSKYKTMKTEDTMFFTAMTKLKDGRIFAQNYVAYYLTDTTATTYSWIVDANGNWTKVQGTLTLPKELTSSGAMPNTKWYRYGFSRAMIELDDGTLLGSMYGSYGAIMVESKDLGKTWTYRSTIAESAVGLERPYVNTDGTDITWFEPAVTRCADGTLLCVMRTWREKPLYQTRSYDNGLTWTEPSLMPGLEGKSIYPHLVLLSNGVLAMSTGIPDNTIYFSLDGCGYNWDYSVTLSSGDTTGNSAITEVGYNAATGTVTLLAFGDTGFNNLSASGVWGKVVTVTRKHASNPDMIEAVVRADKSLLGLKENLQVRLDAIFNSDSGLITDGYTLEWKSSNPAVATVDQTGKVTAVSVGTAQVYAIVSRGGKTIMSNKLPVTVSNRNVPIGIDNTTVSRWVLKVGQMGSVTAVAENAFGQQFVNSYITQVYINGNPNEPMYLKSNVKWSFESLKPEVLRVDASTGAFRGLTAGVADLRATATVGNTTFTKTITLIVTGDEWVTESFEGSSLPANCTATNLVTLSTGKAYSGKQSVCINDTSKTLAPVFTYKLPKAAKAVVVEFMLYTESNEHAPCFGVGYPKADGTYNWESNTAYVGLLYNPHTGAQGYQVYNGKAWGVNDRTNKIPFQQWNKIRLEVATDKSFRMYVNDTLISDELPLATPNELLDTIFFGSGSTGLTGDTIYIDDLRYMVLN